MDGVLFAAWMDGWMLVGGCVKFCYDVLSCLDLMIDGMEKQ